MNEDVLKNGTVDKIFIKMMLMMFLIYLKTLERK